jgi:hypothetical protein
MESGIRIGPEPSAVPPFPVLMAKNISSARGVVCADQVWTASSGRRQAEAGHEHDPVLIIRRRSRADCTANPDVGGHRQEAKFGQPDGVESR